MKFIITSTTAKILELVEKIGEELSDKHTEVLVNGNKSKAILLINKKGLKKLSIYTYAEILDWVDKNPKTVCLLKVIKENKQTIIEQINNPPDFDLVELLEGDDYE